MPRSITADRLNHPAATPSPHGDAWLWSAMFPRRTLDERATALARDDHAAHSDADEFTARALPVGFIPGAVDGSRLTAFRTPARRKSA